MIFPNRTDHVIGFGGIIYKELERLSNKLNFRYFMIFK